MEVRRCATTFGAVGSEHRGAQPGKAGAADDCAKQQSARAKRVPQREGRSLHVVARFKASDRQAEIEASRDKGGRIVRRYVGNDHREGIAPFGFVVPCNQGSVKAPPDIGQSIEAIIERALVKKQVAADAGRTLAPQHEGVVVE